MAWNSILAGQTSDVMGTLVFGFVIVSAPVHTTAMRVLSVGLVLLVAGALLFVIYGGLCLGATVLACTGR